MTNERDNGGPAFPCQPQWWDPDDMAYKPGDWVPGLTVRDYFAAKAMDAMLGALAATRGDTDFRDVVASISEMSYFTADAMLKARQA